MDNPAFSVLTIYEDLQKVFTFTEYFMIYTDMIFFPSLLNAMNGWTPWFQILVENDSKCPKSYSDKLVFPYNG